MDLVYLKKLLKIFEESNTSELVIEEEGIKLKLVKSSVSFPAEQTHYFQVQQPQSQQFQQIPAANTNSDTNISKQPVETQSSNSISTDTSNLHTIHSPIVGTFYRSPSPDAGPFVEAGSYITSGKPLCIIEAMKLMNEIESDINGTVEKILVQNGQPVEYNQPLFLIRPE